MSTEISFDFEHISNTLIRIDEKVCDKFNNLENVQTDIDTFRHIYNQLKNNNPETEKIKRELRGVFKNYVFKRMVCLEKLEKTAELMINDNKEYHKKLYDIKCKCKTDK